MTTHQRIACEALRDLFPAFASPGGPETPTLVSEALRGRPVAAESHARTVQP